jgi:hypothetical protein
MQATTRTKAAMQNNAERVKFWKAQLRAKERQAQKVLKIETSALPTW